MTDTKSIKIFELLDIEDFSLQNAEENSKKCELLANRLYSESNPEWERAWKLHKLFESAFNYWQSV